MNFKMKNTSTSNNYNIDIKDKIIQRSNTITIHRKFSITSNKSVDKSYATIDSNKKYYSDEDIDTFNYSRKASNSSHSSNEHDTDPLGNDEIYTNKNKFVEVTSISGIPSI